MTTNRPILSVVIRPKDGADSERLHRAMLDLACQDPTIPVVRTSANEIEIGAMSESAVELFCEAISSRCGIAIEIGEPSARYLETIRRPSISEGKYIRQTGGSGNYGHCKIRIEPNARGNGYEFINQTHENVMPKNYVDPIDEGIRSAMELGFLNGFPIVDVKATLIDGSFHESDSNPMAFRFAGSIAFKEAARAASPITLEPFMTVAAVVPENRVESVKTEISMRRGRVRSIESAYGWSTIEATVPLSELLSSSSRGPLNFPMEFFGYQEVPDDDLRNGDESGVTANKPRSPNRGHNSGKADP